MTTNRSWSSEIWCGNAKCRCCCFVLSAETCRQVLVCVVVISVCQHFYWAHRRQGIIDLMMANPQWRNKLAKATSEGKTVKITGAEPSSVTDTIFFVLPLLPVYAAPWLYHLGKWFIFQAIMGKEQDSEEERYWMKRQYGWDDQEFDEWAAKREVVVLRSTVSPWLMNAK